MIFRSSEGETRRSTVTNSRLVSVSNSFRRVPGRACRGSWRELESTELSGRADRVEYSSLVSRHRRCSISAQSPIPAIFDVRVAVPGDVPSDGAELLPVCRGEGESRTCKTGLRMARQTADSPHAPKCPNVASWVTYLRATSPAVDHGRLMLRASLIFSWFKTEPATSNRYISHQKS